MKIDTATAATWIDLRNYTVEGEKKKKTSYRRIYSVWCYLFNFQEQAKLNNMEFKNTCLWVKLSRKAINLIFKNSKHWGPLGGMQEEEIRGKHREYQQY